MGSLFSEQGLNPRHWQGQCGVLTTGLQENCPTLHFYGMCIHSQTFDCQFPFFLSSENTALNYK